MEYIRIDEDIRSNVRSYADRIESRLSNANIEYRVIWSIKELHELRLDTTGYYLEVNEEDLVMAKLLL